MHNCSLLIERAWANRLTIWFLRITRKMKGVDFHYKDLAMESLSLRTILEGTLRLIQANALISEIKKLKTEKDVAYLRSHSCWGLMPKYSSGFWILRSVVSLV